KIITSLALVQDPVKEPLKDYRVKEQLKDLTKVRLMMLIIDDNSSLLDLFFSRWCISEDALDEIFFTT
ncbi:hypothetical protein Tco_1527489, partial [Tanacetum coccineum]